MSLTILHLNKNTYISQCELICLKVEYTFLTFSKRNKRSVTREWIFASFKLMYTMVQFNVIDMVTLFNDVRILINN